MSKPNLHGADLVEIKDAVSAAEEALHARPCQAFKAGVKRCLDAPTTKRDHDKMCHECGAYWLLVQAGHLLREAIADEITS